MRWLALLMLLFAPSSITGGEVLERETVATLVRELGSPSRRDRDLAEARLTAASPETLDLLPNASSDPAISTAIARIRRTLEGEGARRAGLPTTMTLEGRQSLMTIEKAVLEQTGQALRVEDSRGPAELAVSWKETPFWEVVSQLEAATKTIARGDPAAKAIVLRPRASDETPDTGVSGPCRVEVESWTIRQNLVDPATSLLQVRWRLRTEPRLRPLYLIVADRDCSLTSGATRFAPLSPDARREIPCDRWEGCEVDTAFQVPPDFESSQALFAVGATVKVAAMPLALRFDDLGVPSPTPRQRGAVMGMVRNVRFDGPGKRLSFDMTVTYERGGPEFESHRMWIYQNAAWLEKKSDGKRLPPESVDLKEIAGSGATLGYVFSGVSGSLEEQSFVYEAPSLVIDVPVLVNKLGQPQ